MSAAPQKKQQPDAAPPSDREALTSAIHADFAARDAVEAKRQVLLQSSRNITEIEARLEAARRSIVKAQERDAQRAAAALDAGRSVTSAASVEKVEKTIRETERLVEVSERARHKLQQELAVLEDQQAFTANEILVAIRWMTRPLAEELLAELRQARHRTAVLTSVLSELFDDDTRSVPRFQNSVWGSNASAARAAPLADLRAAARAPMFGVSSEDQTAAWEIAKSVKAALVELRRNAATPLPKV